MVKSNSKKKLKHISSPLVIMSRMDYEIARHVYERCLEIGLSDEELSFLMGKRNKYVFDLLNPTEKDKFKTEQLDILPIILKTTIRKLVPNDVLPGEQIRLQSEKKVYDDKLIYQHKVTYADGKKSEQLKWVKKLIKGERKKLHPELHQAVLDLVQEGYFNEPQTALNLYLKLTSKENNLSFKISDLQKSLAVLERVQDGKPLLVKTINDARFVYEDFREEEKLPSFDESFLLRF